MLTESTAIAPGYTSFFSHARGRLRGAAYSGVAVIVSNTLPVQTVEEGVTGFLAQDDDDGLVDDESVILVDADADALGASSAAIDAERSVESSSPIAPRVLDAEGRALIVDLGSFVLINVYAPAVTHTSRTSFKWQYHEALRLRAQSLVAAGRHVVIVGDLNVSHRAIDRADAAEWVKHAGCAFNDSIFRRWMDALLNASQQRPATTPAATGDESCRDDGRHCASPSDTAVFVDAFRFFNGDIKKAYTHWNMVTSARETNYGSRIDYAIFDASMLARRNTHAHVRAVACRHDTHVMGSDHCPVVLELEISSVNDGDICEQGLTPCGTVSPNHQPVRRDSRAPHPASVNALPEFALRQQTLRAVWGSGAAGQKRRAADQMSAPSIGDAAAADAQLAGALRSSQHSSASATPATGNFSTGRLESESRRQRRAIQSTLTSTFIVPAATPQSASTIQSTSSHTEIVDLLSSQDECTNSAHDTSSDIAGSSAVPANSDARSAPRAAGAQALRGAWASILEGPMPGPRCRCGEAAVERQVLKQGPNVGLWFYVCGRPEGTKDHPKARCDFFIWAEAHRKEQLLQRNKKPRNALESCQRTT